MSKAYCHNLHFVGISPGENCILPLPQEIILLIVYYFLLIHPILQASHNRTFRGAVKILVRNSEKYSRFQGQIVPFAPRQKYLE